MMQKHRTRSAAVLLAAAALAACGGGEERAEEAVVVAADTAAGMQGMHGMPGMQGMGAMQSGPMMEQMQAHMQAMEGADGERYRAMLPQHRQMVANLIAQMNREMREMNMAADEEWSSTVEALRQDLRQMPEMSAQELETFMPEHRQRVMRLMEMHRGMMGGMQM